jgi:hypothetical protein
MTQKSRHLTRIWLLAMLTACLLLLSACGHRQSGLVVLPEDRRITQMDNGNYEVTPAWLQERYRYEAWVTEQLEKCRKAAGK